MKAHIALGVDGGQEGCTGHGRCAVMAGDVPPGLEDSARYGAKVCPERVITIEE